MITKIEEVVNEVEPRIRGFEPVIEEQREFPNNIIQMPLRGSKTSAGYDLYSNEEVAIEPGQKHFFWTDIKAYMLNDEVLKIYVRSSIGIKKGLVLCNQVGIIDSDYYSNTSNDGNLGVCLFNRSGIPQEIETGDRIAQCIFEKFLVSDNCNTEEDRTGGIGSTD
jgi:dUTP diphosphatase